MLEFFAAGRPAIIALHSRAGAMECAARPGGHSFNRLDTKAARESRKEVYQFLAKYLNPPNPPR